MLLQESYIQQCSPVFMIDKVAVQSAVQTIIQNAAYNRRNNVAILILSTTERDLISRMASLCLEER